MKKEKTLFGIIGLLAGVIIGYVGTNYINTAYGPGAPGSAASADGPANMPANHPPMGGNAGQTGSGEDGGAMAAINKARQDPTDFEAQIQAANLFRQIDRNEQALEFLTTARKIKPNDFDLLVNLGNTTFDLKQYETAEGWYQKALQVKPDDVVVRMDLGLTWFLRQPHDIDRAISEYRKALAIDSGHEKTLQNMIAALIEKGDKSGARQYLTRLEQVNPSNQAIAQFKELLRQ